MLALCIGAKQVLFPAPAQPLPIAVFMDLSDTPHPCAEPSEGPSSAADERQALRLWLRLLGCTHRIEQALRQRLRREFGTSLARFDYLAQLHLFPQGLRMKALSRRLMVTGGNVTGLTDQLLAEGYVTREVDVHDRRSQIVRMTPEGLAQFERMALAHRRWVDALMVGVPPAEQRQLLGLLAGLSRTLDARPGGHEDAAGSGPISAD